MRAKKVNETQNFERGRNTKAALGIGGIDLKTDFEEKLEDLKKDVSMTKLTYDDNYEEHLRKLLVGKTITAELKPLPGFNTKTKETLKRKTNGEYTIKVQDIKLSQELSKSMENVFTGTQTIIVADMESTMYQMELQKIYIEDES